MLDWLRRLARQRRETREIAALEPRVFADMGVSRDQALNLVQMPEAVTDRVQAMGHVFGHAPAELTRKRAEWVQMVEACAQCHNIPQCQRFLRQDGHPGPNGAGFCPNREVFAGLAARPVRQAA